MVGAQTPLSYDAVLSAVAASPRVVVARTGLELAQKQLNVNASFLQSDLSGGYTRTFSNLTAGGETTTDARGDLDPLQLTTALNVVPYGPYGDRVVRGRWAVEQAEAALRDETAAVVTDVTEQYLGALRAGGNVSVARARLELAQTQREAARTGFTAGTATTAAVTAADLGAQQAEQDLQSALFAQDQALGALSVTLGREVETLAGEPPALTGASVLQSDVLQADVLQIEVTDALLARRGDVLAAALNVAEAELTAAATLRDNLPSGTLSAAYTNANDGSSLRLGAQFSSGGGNAYQPTFSAAIDPDTGLPGLAPGQVESAFSVGLGVNIPLNAALSDALAAARLNVESAKLRAAQTVALARLEVATRAADVTGAAAALSLARQVVDQQQQNLSVARQRLELGVVGALEVQSAEVDVLAANLALRRAEDALRLARLRYLAALALDPREVF